MSVLIWLVTLALLSRIVHNDSSHGLGTTLWQQNHSSVVVETTCDQVEPANKACKSYDSALVLPENGR
jgi:hypothetical protein